MRAPAVNRRALLASGAALAATACSRAEGPPPDLLRVAIDSEADSLNPLQGQFAASALLYKQLHAPLTDYAEDGGLAPGLAQSWSSEDARTWRFTLRESLVWSDGAPITAEDVAWTTRRTVDPATGFADLGDFFAVEGALAALRGERDPDTIGVSAPDARTVVFQLERPVGGFPVLMREFYPLPRHVLETRPTDWVRPEHWVSAGPFLLEDQGALMYRLARNPRYFAADRVSIPAVRIDVIEDNATRARRFRAGDLDLADRPPSDQIGFLRERLGARLHAFPAPILTYLKVNCVRPHLSDPRVRRALSLAIDRAFLNVQFFNGEAAPTPRVIPGADAAAGDGAPNAEAARALLADAGYGPGNPLRVSLRASAGDRDRLAIAILDDWARIGVEGALLASYPLDLYQAVDGGDYDLALARFDRGLKSAPDFMLAPFARGGFADNTNWEDGARADFDAVMEHALAEIDPARREDLHREAEALLLGDMPNIPLLHERAYWMVSERTRVPGAIQPQMWRDAALG